MIFTYGATVLLLPANRYNNQYPGFKPNVTADVAADGSVVAYNGPFTETLVNIRLRLKSAQLASLRAFFIDTVNWAALEFQMTPDSGIDLGGGVNQPQNVRLWQETYAEVPLAYGIWEVAFVLRGLLPPSGGGS
ncbi:hypothetical protein KKH18_07045 [bacterium]|nr:hypothetical protein [bacterium]